MSTGEPIWRASSVTELPPLWDPERDDTLVCRQIRQETHDVRTFVFDAPAPRLFRFLPGQFLTFEFDIGGRRINRCYTIASPPTRPDRVAITVKRKPRGEVSPWLHTDLRPGVAVRVAGPMGAFTPLSEQSAKYLFLSAGSGITPLMSAARTLDDLGSGADVVFVHGARTPADIIFRDELEMMSARSPGFRLAVHCTGDAPLMPWPGLRGRIGLPMLSLFAPDFMDRQVFVCGPAGYMDRVRAMLAESGFDPARVHEESFDFGRLQANEPEATAAPADGFQITFARSERSVGWDNETTILDASRRAGLRLPSSCTRGVCGTCKSRLIAGEVDMRHGGGIRQREIDQGMILICCARPKSDVVIDR